MWVCDDLSLPKIFAKFYVSEQFWPTSLSDPFATKQRMLSLILLSVQLWGHLYRHEKIWQHPLMMSVWIRVSLLLNKDSRVSHLAVSNVSEIAIPSHTSYGRILRVLYHMLPIPRIAAIIPWMISRMRSLICRHIHHHASYTSRFISTRNSEI